MALRAADWPSDPLLGKTHYTVGLINGGVAPNVIPPNAEAEVFFRTVGDHAPLRELLHRPWPAALRCRRSSSCRPLRMHTVPGFDTAVFSYFSDIPFLSNWGTPLLLGPGSIHVAHTDREHLAIDELNRAVDVYAQLAASLVAPARPMCVETYDDGSSRRHPQPGSRHISAACNRRHGSVGLQRNSRSRPDG